MRGLHYLLVVGLALSEPYAPAAAASPADFSPTTGISSFSIGGPGGAYLVDGITGKAFIYLKARWPTSDDGVTRIPVCWERPKTADEHYRTLVRANVEKTWQDHSAILFENWHKCMAQDRHAIHVAVGPAWPATKRLGKELAGLPSGMQLNFNFQALPEWKASCSSMLEACVIKSAIHEFGHALGFVHEQVRSDRPDTCLKFQPGEKKTIRIDAPGYTTAGTPWDSESVMNYCNPVWNNGGRLSKQDVVALQRIYGAPKP